MLFVAAVVLASYVFVLIPLPETLDCNKVGAVYKLFLGTKNSSLSLEIILKIYNSSWSSTYGNNDVEQGS